MSGAAETKSGEPRLRVRPGAALAILGGLVLIHLWLGYLLFDPKPFIGGDNAAYMGLAESIETGQGYRDLYLPTTPRHAQYPPFYPATLAAIRGAGGGLIAFKILSLLCTAGAVCFAYLLARERLGAHGALAVAVPFALSPVLLYYSHWVLSEAPFGLLTLIALWAAERAEGDERARLWTAGAVLAAILAYLTRAAGLPLLLALLIVPAWRRQWTRVGAHAAAIVPVVVGWWWWGRAVASENPSVYANNFLLANPYAPEGGYVGPGALLVRVVENVRRYGVEVLPQMLAGREPPGALALLALLVSLIVIALALAGWARGLREVRTLELFTFFYLGLIALWPQVWTDQRFLLPLLPALLIHSVAGLGWAFDFARWPRPAWVYPAFGALLGLLALPNDAGAALENRACARLYRQGDHLACYTPPWRAFAEAGDWVRENTAEGAVVVSRKPRLLYYFGRRRGDVYPFTSVDSEMLAFFDRIGADYVIVAGLSGTTMRYLIPAIRAHPELFLLLHRVGAGPSAAYVLGYRPDPATDSPRGAAR